MHWRWDQGRLDYFQFDNICRIAKELCELENFPLRSEIDPLRSSLTSATGLPFAPTHYRVWRNYGRVFGCCVLATSIDDKIVCTEICHALAESGEKQLQASSYFEHFVRNFAYPSPVFQGYNSSETCVYPCCAIIKFLLSRLHQKTPASITTEQIFSYIIANECTGQEDVSFYKNLKPKKFIQNNDEERQVRELIKFISQIEFLKWSHPSLFLDCSIEDTEQLEYIRKLAEPILRQRSKDPATELLMLGNLKKTTPVPIGLKMGGLYGFSAFEGTPKQVTHVRYERSPKLREMFFSHITHPYLCDMCRLDVSKKYPWTVNILELHHLMPLASPIRVTTRQTSLHDLVAVCPSCHKSTHVYYRNWLKDSKKDDFANQEEAVHVYKLAKDLVLLT